MKLYIEPDGWELISESGEILENRQTEMSTEFIIKLLQTLEYEYDAKIEIVQKMI